MIPYKSFAACFIFSTFFFQLPPSPIKYQERPFSTGSAETTIHFSSTMGNVYFLPPSSPQSGPTEFCLYLEMNSEEQEKQNNERTPLNISLVIDKSGSMKGDNMKYVKIACNSIIKELDKEDKLSVIVYNNSSQVLVKTIPMTHPDSVIAKINAVVADGGTNIEGGLVKGYAELVANYDKKAVNKLILLSDGMANAGITNPVQLAAIASEKKLKNNISLSSFGVGREFNENLMNSLAESGNGNYYFIDSAGKVESILAQEFNEIMNIQGMNGKITVQLPKGISLIKSYGYTVTQNNNTLNIELGDIFPYDSKGILLKFRIDDPSQMNYNFCSTLSYDDPFADNRTKYITRMNSISSTTNTEEFKNNVDLSVMQQAVLFESNDRLAQAIKEIDRDQYDNARKIVAENRNYLKEQFKYMTPTEELLIQDSMNTAYESQIKDAERMSRENKLMMQKYNKMNTTYMEKKKMDKNPYYKGKDEMMQRKKEKYEKGKGKGY